MKHSTFLKFICIVLCAASILTLACSGLGIWCMVELDLYNKTVDQYLNDVYRGDSQYYARVLAQRYASHELGGLPEDFLENEYLGWFDQAFGENGLGYLLMDEDGNVLQSLNPEVKDHSHQAFTVPIEGNYMHMIHSEPVPQEAPKEYSGLGPGEYGIIDRVGEGAAPVFGIRISHDGGSEAIGTSDSSNPLGWLSRADDGSIRFEQASDISFSFSDEADITHITFLDGDNSILYEAADTNPVASIFQMPSGHHFLALYYETNNGNPIGNPAWQPVYQASFYGADLETPVEVLKGTQPIGAARLDDGGHLEFNLYIESSKLKEARGIYSLVLMDQDGTVLFGQAQPLLQTATTDGQTFSSHPDAVIAAMPTEAAPMEAAAEEADKDTPDEAASAEASPATGETAPELAAAEEGAAQEAPAEVQQAPAEAAPAAETLPQEETIPVTAPETTPETVPETVPETTAPPETVAALVEETAPDYRDMMINGKSVREFDIETYTYYNPETQQNMSAKVIFLPMPAYTVEIFLRPDLDENAYAYTLMGLLQQYSFLLLPVLLGSLVILALSIVYLCVSAGHRRTGEIKAGGLNRIPLDLYTVLAGSAMTGLVVLATVTCTDLLPKNMELGLVLTPLLAYAVCLIFVGYCFAWVSQCKTPGGYWWRNSLIGRLLFGSFGSLEKGMAWGHRKFFPWLWSVFCRIWELFLLILAGCYKLLRRIWRKAKALIHDFLRWIFYAIRRFFSILPLTWQWIIGGLTLLFFGVLVWANRRDGWGFLWFLAGLGLVLYISHCFGILLERTKKMNQGDLESKIDDKQMVGCFREFADDLNSLADVVVVAAQKQLRSERMKTELITNVSHDIKTPLTSIINYVDLLRKPHSQEEGEQYLDVLDRQSQRLKKLIDDLMDMSKANTGNMNAEITRLDAVESVNQALGEFADKLEKAELTPLFRHNADEAFVMADGRLLWRVLSNLLSNAVKYAMPGTRLYVDLMKLDGRVVISLKNISRDELNVDAEELMERFVRGDDSRNTEGSGLGLNIAKSLMELQKGHLQLLVDGDLFKVTLVFPAAE